MSSFFRKLFSCVSDQSTKGATNGDKKINKNRTESETGKAERLDDAGVAAVAASESDADVAGTETEAKVAKGTATGTETATKFVKGTVTGTETETKVVKGTATGTAPPTAVISRKSESECLRIDNKKIKDSEKNLIDSTDAMSADMGFPTIEMEIPTSINIQPDANKQTINSSTDLSQISANASTDYLKRCDNKTVDVMSCVEPTNFLKVDEANDELDSDVFDDHVTELLLVDGDHATRLSADHESRSLLDDDGAKLKLLERLVSFKAGNEVSSVHRTCRKQYSDSNFYDTDGKKYPTADEQREMARKMAHSVHEPANIGSRGYTIFVRCKARCARWTTGVTQEELAAALAFVDEENKKNKNSPKNDESEKNTSTIEPTDVIKRPDIVTREPPTSIASTSPRPQTFLDLSNNLLRPSDKGSRLFARRQAKSESWVVPGPSVTPTPVATAKIAS